MAKRLQLYKAYVFKSGDKDPVIDKIHTMLEDAGASYGKASELSGVSHSTIHAWIEGDTKKPQYCTIAAVAGALGYEVSFTKKSGAEGINVVNIKRRRVA